ncbi:uncharacterized protein [Patagioenas fasciata]|uniref:uncharacterized protein n=1 Tax=Patagioenas fasciata TaxID=372321 RepID=UPI003A9A4F57
MGAFRGTRRRFAQNVSPIFWPLPPRPRAPRNSLSGEGWKEKENTGVLVKSQGGVSFPGLPFHPIFKFFRGAGLAGRDRDPPPASQRQLCPRRGRGRGPGGASPSVLLGGAPPSLSLPGAGGRISLPQIIKAPRSRARGRPGGWRRRCCSSAGPRRSMARPPRLSRLTREERSGAAEPGGGQGGEPAPPAPAPHRHAPRPGGLTAPRQRRARRAGAGSLHRAMGRLDALFLKTI